MGIMTISIPDDLKAYIDAQVGEEFADAGEFLAKLVRQDRERMEQVRRIVDESLASGVSQRTVEQRIAEGDRLSEGRLRLHG